MLKLLFVTGSRGEWGYIRPILKLIKTRNDIEYRLVVTNMHLLPAYGNSYREIEKDGFTIHHRINMSLDGYSHCTHAKSLGIFLLSMPDIIEQEKPDWVILAGDRGEQLMGAIAAGYTYTPVAHIQAGEVSGNIDGMARHAIGKFVHLHFASNEDARQRLINLGEQEFRCKNVGAPQIDEMVSGVYSDMSKLQEDLSIDLTDGFILAVLHPLTEEYCHASEQAEIFIRALNKCDLPKVLIKPNNDAGSSSIMYAIEHFREGRYYIYENLKREDYLCLLKNCKCIVGNSSSGLLEAPTFRTPAVNIGNRQKSRFRGNNVLDVDFDVDKIIAAIKKATSDEFRRFLFENCDSPYGDGHSSKRILDILLETKIDDTLLTKQLTY
ncbi:MAG: UDP-N-acetylglucosamine 2-epimerase [Treponemataceae bacterium]